MNIKNDRKKMDVARIGDNWSGLKQGSDGYPKIDKLVGGLIAGSGYCWFRATDIEIYGVNHHGII